MTSNRFTLNVALFAIVGLSCFGLSGCSNAFRNIEEPYMRPGALDSPIATNFDEYKIKFLDRYWISHAWPVSKGCGYRSQNTKYKIGDIDYGDVKLVRDIFEKDGSTWQRFPAEIGPYNLNSYVRSVIRHQPIYANVDGRSQIVRYEDQEQGLQAMCFQAWVGTSHALIFRLHKRDVTTWKNLWTQYNPKGTWSKQHINGITWDVLENSEEALQATGVGGWFKSFVAPIADTDYSLSLQLGASQDSLLHPQAHAAMQVMFRRLVESVKIESLTPAIEAEQAQLKARAEAIVRQECVESAQRGKPGPWCKAYAK
jgi:hypothetical protein